MSQSRANGGVSIDGHGAAARNDAPAGQRAWRRQRPSRGATYRAGRGEVPVVPDESGDARRRWRRMAGGPDVERHAAAAGREPYGHPRRLPTLFELGQCTPLVAAVGLFSILVNRCPGSRRKASTFSNPVGALSLTRRFAAPSVQTPSRGDCRRCVEAIPKRTLRSAQEAQRCGGPREATELRSAASAGRRPAGIVRHASRARLRLGAGSGDAAPSRIPRSAGAGTQGRHIEALVEEWRRQGLSDGTMRNRLAHLHWWAMKIGKPGIVRKDNVSYGIG